MTAGRDDSRPRLAAGGRAGRRVRRVTQSPIPQRGSTPTASTTASTSKLIFPLAAIST